MKSLLEKKITYVVGITMLIAGLVFISMVNLNHWHEINPFLTGNGIERNLRSLVMAIVFSILGIYALYQMELRGYERKLYWVLPIAIVLMDLLMNIGFSLTANGKTWWLTSFGSDYVCYHIVLLYFLFLTAPRAIESFINKKHIHEVLLISLYSIAILLLCVTLYGGMNGALLCASFIVIYYILRSRNKYRFLVLVPEIIGMVYAIFYGINAHFSTYYFTTSLQRIFGRGAEEQALYMSFISGDKTEMTMAYVFWNQLIALDEWLGIVAAVGVVILLVLIIVLLHMYISKIIPKGEKSFTARFLVNFMTVCWCISLLSEFGVTDIDMNFNVPFMGGAGSFVWILVIMLIFRLGGKDFSQYWKERLTKNMVETIKAEGYTEAVYNKEKEIIIFEHMTESNIKLDVIIGFGGDEYIVTNIFIEKKWDDEKHILKVVNEFNCKATTYRAVSNDNNINVKQLYNIKHSKNVDMLDWLTDVIICIDKTKLLYEMLDGSAMDKS